MNQKTIIIAEAGVNHNGDLIKAKELISVAKEAGADIVKFQTFNAQSLATKSAPKASYQKITTSGNESQFDMIKKLELSETDHFALIECCQKLGVEFLSTPFDEASIDLLLKLGIKTLKIPSGEVTNLPFLRYAMNKFDNYIMSTGISDLDEINWLVEFLQSSGVQKSQMTILHCNTEYPTPFEDVHLRAMQTIHKELGVNVGYSDHTLGIEVPIAAVAMGASMIEKHITLDKNLLGPDHKTSIDPQEFTAMVKAIRNIETALGRAEKLISPSALKNLQMAKKSIVAKHKIQAGEIFSAENITTKRPALGIDPRKWDQVIGQIAKRDFEPDDFVEL